MLRDEYDTPKLIGYRFGSVISLGSVIRYVFIQRVYITQVTDGYHGLIGINPECWREP